MSSVRSAGLASATQLFILTAALEVGAGAALLAVPDVAIRLLFGPSVTVFPAVGLARVAGAALVSIGAACWWARADGRSTGSRALIGGLLIYNTAVVALGLLGTLGALAVLQWAAVVIHAVQAIWCVRILAAPPR